MLFWEWNGRGSVDGWWRVCLEKGLMSLVSVDIKNFPSSLCFSFVLSFPGLIKETDATCNCCTGIDTKRVHGNLQITSGNKVDFLLIKGRKCPMVRFS